MRREQGPIPKTPKRRAGGRAGKSAASGRRGGTASVGSSTGTVKDVGVFVFVYAGIDTVRDHGEMVPV